MLPFLHHRGITRASQAQQTRSMASTTCIPEQWSESWLTEEAACRRESQGDTGYQADPWWLEHQALWSPADSANLSTTADPVRSGAKYSPSNHATDQAIKHTATCLCSHSQQRSMNRQLSCLLTSAACTVACLDMHMPCH